MEQEVIEKVEVKEEVNRVYKYIYGIAFRQTLQTYYFGSDETFKIADKVVVETVRGVELGAIKTKPLLKKEIKHDLAIKPILRKATKNDIDNYNKNIAEAKEAEIIFNNAVKEENLDMHLVSSELTLDGSKIIFTYIADERVDFRNLLKVLASKLHCRIELKQIGARDRSKSVGGLGPCGLPLCCATFLSDFEGISINMAKNQLLALNIPKLSGQCGKLICCLKYEDSIYSDLRVGLPKMGQRCIYKDEEFKITSMNVLSKTMKLENKENIIFITFDEYFKDVKYEKKPKLSEQ